MIHHYRIIGSGKSAHCMSHIRIHRSHLQNDKAVIRLSTGWGFIEKRKRGGAENSPWDSINVLFLPLSDPLLFFPVIVLRFFRWRDTSQSRNPKLLNYFPIVVATDHVYSSSGNIRLLARNLCSRHCVFFFGIFSNRARGFSLLSLTHLWMKYYDKTFIPCR